MRTRDCSRWTALAGVDTVEGVKFLVQARNNLIERAHIIFFKRPLIIMFQFSASMPLLRISSSKSLALPNKTQQIIQDFRTVFFCRHIN